MSLVSLMDAALPTFHLDRNLECSTTFTIMVDDIALCRYDALCTQLYCSHWMDMNDI